jgi:hypothetical protein
MIEQLKALNGMLALGDFTVEQVERLTGVQSPTVHTVIHRHPDAVERLPAAPTGRRGGQPARYRIKSGAIEPLREQILQIRRAFAADLPDAGDLADSLNLDAAEEFLTDRLKRARTPAAKHSALETADGYLAAARSEFEERFAGADTPLARERARRIEAVTELRQATEAKIRLAEVKEIDERKLRIPRTEEPVAITVDRWEDEADNSGDPVRATTALLHIAFGDKVATRHLEPLSRAVEDSAPLSAYPLALWLASSWWRLRWDCRQEHNMTAAGHGFVWPPLSLSSNGERIYARCCAEASPSAQVALQYFEKFDVSVPVADFERAVDSFIKHVLGRLAGIGKTELGTVWHQLIVERSDPATSAYRRLEAMLGFNREQASKEILQQLGDLAGEAGPSSRDELAWASENNSVEMLTKTAGLARSSAGVHGHIAVSPSDLDHVSWPSDEPWVRGHKMARECRKYFNFGFDPVDDVLLGDTLSISEKELNDESTPAKSIPLSLAVRNQETGDDRFMFHLPNRYFRRFEAARFLGDSLLAHAADQWLLGTRARTARQQAQRAFANEFIAPTESLSDFLGRDRSDEKFEEASLYWGLGSNMIRRHVELNATQLA